MKQLFILLQESNFGLPLCGICLLVDISSCSIPLVVSYGYYIYLAVRRYSDNDLSFNPVLLPLYTEHKWLLFLLCWPCDETCLLALCVPCLQSKVNRLRLQPTCDPAKDKL